MENHPKFSFFYRYIWRLFFYFLKNITTLHYQKLCCLCSWGVLYLLCSTTTFAEAQNSSIPSAASELEAVANTDDVLTKPKKIKDEQILETVNITYDRAAKNSISDETGGSVYRIGKKEINELPLGENTPLNQVLIEAPGVVSDSHGQIHIRGDHANIQYRINGVILPQGISGFGQNIDTRFAQTIDLMTGALPAEFGTHTAGVVDITTKSNLDHSGSVSVFGGSFHTFNPSFQYGGSSNQLSYFMTGSYLTNNIGIENPTNSNNPIHDTTRQTKGFAHLSYLVDSGTKISIMGGTYSGAFQIPNTPGLQGGSSNPASNPYFALGTASTTNPYSATINYQSNSPSKFNSSSLNDQQFEESHFISVSLQRWISEDFSYQASLFSNTTTTHYIPDSNGNLYFNGVSSDVLKSSVSNGLQFDSTYQLNDTHSLKIGMISDVENVSTNDSSLVYALDPLTGVVTGQPFSISDNTAHHGNLLIGLYAQDSWSVNPKLKLNYGLRYDYFNAFVSGSQLSPRLGFVYKKSENTTLHAGYSHYYTPPPNELVSGTTQSLFVNTTNAIPGLNNTVRPESGDYYDIGLSKKITNYYSFGLDAYLKNTKDTLDEGQFGPALILTPFNYAYGRVAGLELTNSYRRGSFSAYLNLSQNLSQAKNIISSQYLFDQLTLQYASNNWVNVDHEQTHSLSGGISYLSSGIRYNANMIYASGLRNGFANTGVLPAYSVLNLGLTKSIEMKGLGTVEYRLAVNNALDRVYEIRDGSGIGIYAPQFGPRRSIYIGAMKQF